MSEEQPINLATMTAEIVASYVMNNEIGTAEVASLIGSVYVSLKELGKAPKPEAAPEKPKGAVGIRKSLASSGKIISMIDGKPYAMLMRHIKRHGYTPASYRETFGLPTDYPMTAPAYSERRRTISLANGLGRKKAPPPPLPKRGRRKVAATA